MARTTYLTASTVDGFIATEDHDLGWLLQLEGDDGSNPYDEFIESVGALAMGAHTYTWMLEHVPGPWPYAERPTWVFSHRPLPGKDDAPIRFAQGDVLPVHEQMLEAAAGGDLWLVGGGDLVGQFLDHDLLDDIWVSYAPVVLGSGAPLLPRRRSRPMRVVDVRHTPGGSFVHVHYSLR